jgi:homoisocitrate dehydrogenase
MSQRLSLSPGSPARGARRIALLPGDGIGPEVVGVARQALRRLLPGAELVELEVGWGAFEQTGSALPTATVAELRRCDGALLGAVASPSRRVDGYRSPVVELRRLFDLHANLRPAVSAPVSGSRAGVDLLVVRENTEGLYGAPERTVGEPGGPDEAVITERRISRRASERIGEVALSSARERGRCRDRKGRVTVVHKANVLRRSDALFRECVLGAAASYPDVEVDEILVDAAAYHLARTPERFDVLVAPNLYGDILSDLVAALTGGLGLAPSVNAGETFVVAEPVHGSAPDLAGRGLANPVATLRAAALLLDRVGEPAAAARLSAAVEASLAGPVRTPDIGGTASTEDVARDVLGRLEALQRSIPTTVRHTIRTKGALSDAPLHRLR